MTLLLLIACTFKHPDTGESADADADADSDTGTLPDATGDPTVDLVVGDCANLLAPMPLDTLDDVDGAVHLGGSPTASVYILILAENFADDACPTVRQGWAPFVTEIIAGEGCTTGDGAFMSGRIAVAVWADPEEIQLVAESFTMTWSDSVDHIDVFADGAYSESSGSQQADIWVRYDVSDGYRDPRYLAGEAYTRGTLSLDGAAGYDMAGYVYHPRDDEVGPVGDYCYTGSYSEDGRCPEEANGVLTLDGDLRATVTSDGWEDCDQCGKAAIEGVDVGEVCGLYDPQ